MFFFHVFLVFGKLDFRVQFSFKETPRVEVWENEKLKWEHEAEGRVLFTAISSSPKFPQIFL